MRARKPRSASEADDDERHRGQGDPLVLRPVDAGGDRGQVEPDQHDHRAGDGRGQHLVHDADAGEVDEQADEGQDDAGDQDRADDVAGVTAVGADRDHATDEGGAGAQVAGHLALHDEQEEDRRDPAHHDREVRVQAHDQREDEGRAEHGDHVLRADADGARPGQPLVRGHRLAQRRGLAVPVELPAERHLSASLDVLRPTRSGAGRRVSGAPGGATVSLDTPGRKYLSAKSLLHFRADTSPLRHLSVRSDG